MGWWSTGTDQSLTSSEKFARSLLETREHRQDSLARIVREAHPAVVFFSLNIPGPEKSPPGVAALHDWMMGELTMVFPGLSVREQGSDLLGPYAIVALDVEPYAAKKRCMLLEAMHPSARLVDLDVYSPTGVQIDRGAFGAPARACLLCAHQAAECIRLKRHRLDEIIERTHELLARFRT